VQRGWQRQSKREVRNCCPCSHAYIALFPGRRRTAWQLPRVQIVTSAAKKLAYQSNLRILSHDNSKTHLHHALNCHCHARSISIAIAHIRCSAWWLFPNDFHKQECPSLTAGKFVSITCTNPVLTGRMRYCNYLDVRFVYSLNLRKLIARPFFLRPGNEAKAYIGRYGEVLIQEVLVQFIRDSRCWSVNLFPSGYPLLRLTFDRFVDQ